jgi:hypothetical protein
MSLIHSLPRGKDRARPIGELAESLRLQRRRVERDLESIVLSGIPVVACESGVYVTDSPSEAREYAAALKGRIKHIADRAAALERWADAQDNSGQLSWTEAA